MWVIFVLIFSISKQLCLAWKLKSSLNFNVECFTKIHCTKFSLSLIPKLPSSRFSVSFCFFFCLLPDVQFYLIVICFNGSVENKNFFLLDVCFLAIYLLKINSKWNWPKLSTVLCVRFNCCCDEKIRYNTDNQHTVDFFGTPP